MQRSYGRIVGVPAERVRHSHDGLVVELAGRALRLIDTPGHARHHHCVWDERSRGWFTGDTFGLSYREFDTARGPWLFPTTTPVQFDPPALRASVERLLAADPACLYLTHYGRVDDVARLGAMFLAQLDDAVALGRALRDAPDRHAALKQGLTRLYLDRVERQGCALAPAEVVDLLAMDIELNAQGMGIWLDRETRR
jgi:glyoxylase-like metal-dependent hydrolase (beta-lactamase superfamily II)